MSPLIVRVYLLEWFLGVVEPEQLHLLLLWINGLLETTRLPKAHFVFSCFFLEYLQQPSKCLGEIPLVGSGHFKTANLMQPGDRWYMSQWCFFWRTNDPHYNYSATANGHDCLFLLWFISNLGVYDMTMMKSPKNFIMFKLFFPRLLLLYPKAQNSRSIGFFGPPLRLRGGPAVPIGGRRRGEWDFPILSRKLMIFEKPQISG